MLAKQILDLLKKVSTQLEEIALVQTQIREEMTELYREVIYLRNERVEKLEARIAKPNEMLN